MTSGSTIPAEIVVGVTGTRRLPSGPALANRVREVLAGLAALLPPLTDTPVRLVALSPLAEGADRLVAREILACPDGALEVVLPLEKDDYLEDFESVESKREFESLLGRARRASRVTPPRQRPLAYSKVGRHVVDHCDVLIAVWDGQPAAGQGGTAEIVRYARESERPIFWIHTEEGHGLTEEPGQGINPASFEDIDRYNRESLDGPAVQRGMEQFRDDVESHAEEVGLDPNALAPAIDQLVPPFVRADFLAQRYQRRFQRAGTLIYSLAAASVAVSGFQVLFWTEIHALALVSALSELLSMLLILGLLWRGVKKRWQSKWIDYRFLAERLRTAFFMHVAGVQIADTQPPRHLSLSYSTSDWMVSAFRAACGSGALRPSPATAERRAFVRRAWIEDQLEHHRKSSERNHRAHVRLGWAGNALFSLTFVAAAVHFLPGNPEAVMSWVGITFPAVGAALAAIRTHREYHRISARSGEMADHLRRAAERLEATTDPDEFRALIREAEEMMANENADWRVVVRFHELEAA
ncbi:MAG: SLATT domain-containing protein [Gemmatimonadota bacterium]